MRLIDADAVHITAIGGRMNGKVEFAKAIEEAIKKAPTIDAVPVIYGQWLTAYGEHISFGVRPHVSFCSACNEVTAFKYRYCPNCGARMRDE